ncbi:Retrovirus-related Pol poly from transposon [Abeliophyllum distichum]|uniref:Retrovirus-related Pol poly from transposon n=1 Tax=Abeliophyllum distichum TaxID=126358 RepID=A0ABD1PET0_9LAMI
MFGILYKYRIKRNPLKCTFGVTSRKFLSYVVNQRGIEANPKKIKALIDMRSPSSPKEVQSLTKRLAALNRFISKATDHYQPFFQNYQGKNGLNERKSVRMLFGNSKPGLEEPLCYSSPRMEKLYSSTLQYRISR